MLINKILLFFYLWFFLIACNNSPDKRNTTPAEARDSMLTGATHEETGITAEPGIAYTDSLQVIYYDNPDGDSIRYTRYYTYAVSKDSQAIKALVTGLNEKPEWRNTVKDCRSEGKIFLFKAHAQEPIKTVYFSTRCDTCCYLYFIKNGNFLYFKLSAELINVLKEIKKNSLKP